ncbi:unnamed protein product, partial [Pocillopora meandrina]
TLFGQSEPLPNEVRLLVTLTTAQGETLKGANSWLNAMPLADQGLALNKQEFRDSLRLRYNLPVVDLPSLCVGGFVAQRHDGVRNLST